MADERRPLIFIDTCSLLISCWDIKGRDDKGNEIPIPSKSKQERFWGPEFASLVANGDVIIPKRNYDELVKHSGNKSNPGLASRATEMVARIGRLHKEGSLQIVGDMNDPFADATLLSVALKFKMQRNQLVVTQDHALAEDLEIIRHFASLKDHQRYDIYDIKIRKIADSGELVPWTGLTNSIHKRFKKIADSEKQPEQMNQETKKSGERKPRNGSKSKSEKAEATKAKKKSWWNA